LDFAFILSNTNAMLYLTIFTLLVAAIAVVTHKLNAKTPCDHNWVDNDHSAKCTKCGKKIPGYLTANNESLSDAA